MAGRHTKLSGAVPIVPAARTSQRAIMCGACCVPIGCSRNAIVWRKGRELVIMDRLRSDGRVRYRHAHLGPLLAFISLTQALALLASALNIAPFELSLRSLEPTGNREKAVLSAGEHDEPGEQATAHDGPKTAVTTNNGSAADADGSALAPATTPKTESEQTSSSQTNPLTCKFVNLGETCGYSEKSGVPLYCLPGQCCVQSPDSASPLCSTDCNGYEKPLIGFEIPTCTCEDQHYYCDEHASCVDSATAGSGVYCRCAKGFKGNGLTCAPTYCEGENPCGTHGTCVPDRETTVGYTCTCDPGYLLITSPAPRCDKCEGEPCGPETAVKECRPGTNGSYSCLCQEGYSLSELNGRKLCHKFSSRCSTSPCGPEEAVQACRDTGESYECLCNVGYKFTRESGEPKCVEHSICDTEPCGAAHLVKECRPTDSGYTCTCQDGAVLVGTIHQPHCINRNPVPWIIAISSVLGVIVLSILSLYVYHQWQRRVAAARGRRSQEQPED
ncbi:EGF-like domain-containing protein, related [Neospora caninum Liverpool]|uniref:EGF-like domain-containing protein, related n=1 Tax=Neospora caninum (strain Liverpool) TaxID=572307 RepID=F0VQ52_NEOCL|nr:EGF-like domain-containing protein, related [Neospora caninum Liverpool]CBZ55849.1 EGF-like domain-containing protein, related [Neospora caninum Liverpool]CEL70593.1 TPA: EGF-like domain-containing protein, related [Neospora caninum Liverpool]|eukprot:XP_003885875.1 EGF-like domain-containing protein, related [Neospora caninum Liverpool]